MNKPKLVQVSQSDVDKIMECNERGDLAYPYLHSGAKNGDHCWYTDADELRAWRSSQHTSGVTNGQE
jgi:hypothetical protein